MYYVRTFSRRKRCFAVAGDDQAVERCPGMAALEIGGDRRSKQNETQRFLRRCQRNVRSFIFSDKCLHNAGANVPQEEESGHIRSIRWHSDPFLGQKGFFAQIDHNGRDHNAYVRETGAGSSFYNRIQKKLASFPFDELLRALSAGRSVVCGRLRSFGCLLGSNGRIQSSTSLRLPNPFFLSRKVPAYAGTFLAISFFFIVSGCVSVGNYPEPSSMSVPQYYRMSPGQFWQGLLFTARSMHLNIKMADARQGIMLIGPISGPTGFSFFTASVNRRRAFFRIRTYIISQRSLNTHVPPRALGVSMTVEPVFQKQESTPLGAMWSDQSQSLIHFERRLRAKKLQRWMSQEILVGETQYWMNHRMAFPSINQQVKHKKGV